MSRRRAQHSPLVLVVNSTHLVRDDHDGQDLLEMIQQRAEQWAASGLVTTGKRLTWLGECGFLTWQKVFNSDDYWVYERLKRYAARMEVIPVSDLPKDKAMAALRNYRRQYFSEDSPYELLEAIYNKVGGRLSYLNRVAKAEDMMKLCNDICEAEKSWFLNKCWILGTEMDDDV